MKTEFTPKQRRVIYEEVKRLLNENNGICEVLDWELRDRISREEYREEYKVHFFWRIPYDEFIPSYFPELEIVKPETATEGYWWPMGAEIRRQKLDEMIELTKKL